MIKHAAGKNRGISVLDTLPASKRRHDASRALDNLQEVYLVDGHKGVVMLGETVAEMWLDVDGSIRVRADATLPASRVDALRFNGLLPGNLRYMQDRRGGALTADTQLDGETHLLRTFQALRTAMIDALRDGTPPSPGPQTAAVDRTSVQQALKGLSWAGDGVVEQESDWELRPRLRGDAVPVRMELEADGLRLSRLVLRQLPAAAEPGGEAVADQAIRINAWLRHARLAISDEGLVAEVRLHPGLIEPGWLATSAYAVAVAARYAATRLRLLAEQPAVAQTYIMMFGSIGEQPAPQGVGG